MSFFFRDLRPDNILLGERGHILLSYFSQWTCVDQEVNAQAVKNLYVAPGKILLFVLVALIVFDLGKVGENIAHLGLV